MTVRWFSAGTLVSYTNKTDRHDIAVILLKVALNTINQPKPIINVLVTMTLPVLHDVHMAIMLCPTSVSHFTV